MGPRRRSKKTKNSDSKNNEKGAAKESVDRPIVKESQANVPFENYSPKSFERAKITWSVSNFSYNHDRKVSLRSSRFYLNAAEPTSWCLGLNWIENDKFIVHVIRTCSNPVQKIRFQVRVGYYNEIECICWQEEFAGEILSNGLCISRVMDISRSNCSCFKIACELFIYKNSIPAPFVCSLNTALAMKVPTHGVLRHRYIPALVASKDGNEYTMDRHILYQSPKLKELLSGAMDNTIDVQFHGLQLKQVLLYLWVKNLDYILDNWIPFDLDLAARALQVSDLEKLLSPKEIHTSSEAGGGHCRFSWKIQDFSMNEEKEFLESDIVSDNTCDEVLWRIKLNEIETSIQAGVEILKGNPEFDVNFQLSVIDTEEKELNTIKQSFFSITDGVSKLENTFIVKDPEGEYKRYLPGDLLSLTCSLCYSDMRFRNRITKIVNHSTTLAVNDLAESMTDLSIVDDTNIIIIAGDRRFRVHKKVLENRSYSFRSLLSGKNKCKVNIENVPGDLMELILHFIYNGKLNTRDYETVRRLYNVLGPFKVDFLKEVCEEFFLFNLRLDNWEDLLERATLTENHNFMRNLIRHIDINPEIVQSKEWCEMRSNPDFQQTLRKLFEYSDVIFTTPTGS